MTKCFFHISALQAILNKATAMLCKIRHYVTKATLRSIYYATFQSHLSYVCTAWDQNIKYNHRISILQRKTKRIIFSLILMNISLPYLQKQKFWNLLILSKWRTVFLLINLFQVLCILYSPKWIYLRMTQLQH